MIRLWCLSSFLIFSTMKNVQTKKANNGDLTFKNNTVNPTIENGNNIRIPSGILLLLKGIKIIKSKEYIAVYAAKPYAWFVSLFEVLTSEEVCNISNWNISVKKSKLQIIQKTIDQILNFYFAVIDIIKDNNWY